MPATDLLTGSRDGLVSVVSFTETLVRRGKNRPLRFTAHEPDEIRLVELTHDDIPRNEVIWPSHRLDSYRA